MPHIPRASVCLAFTLVVGLSASLKATTFYALAFDQASTPFGTIDPTTGVFTQIGSAFANPADDIAVSPTGVVYAVLDSGSLITINTTTAAISVVGTLPSGVQSLAFRPDGTLFGATTTSLYTLNTSTAAGTLLGSLGLGTGIDADNIRFDGSTLFVMTVETNSRLFSLSQTTGAGTLVGSSGIDDVSLGAFFGGVFYGSNAAGAQNHIAQINPATGAGTEGATMNNGYLFALAPASVPEPATFLICGAGLAFLVGKMIRKV
jgi:hypothetical protein